MRNAPSTVWIRNLAAVTVIGLAMSSLAGCETTTNWLKGRKTADADEVNLGVAASDQYVIELSELINGDPATKAEIYADSKAAAQLTPGPSTRLRYALVLATPGHSGTNELEAQSLLRELLSQTELMEPAEISLAIVHLNEVEKRLTLDAESRQLRSETAGSTTESTEDAAVAQHIANVEAENRRLRRSLEEAEGKLEAITSIERSVRDQ